MKIDLSIIICTYNRYELLANNVLNMRKLGYGSDRFEILIVDNSDIQDDCKDFQKFLLKSLPHSRYIYSRPPGLSLARNRGWQEAQGPLCAYLDDDAFPQEGWAEGIIFAFSKPDVDFVGGRVDLEWEGTRPKWLPKEYDEAYSAFKPSLRSRYLQRSEYPVGANMAFRTNILKDSGGFNTNLGRVGLNLLSNEESELCERLVAKGCKGYYCADARAIHHVHRARQSWEWIRRRMAWQGFSESTAPYETTMRWKDDACKVLQNDSLRESFMTISATPTNAHEAKERLIFVRALGDMLFRSERNLEPESGLPNTSQNVCEHYYNPDISNLMIAEMCTHSYLYNGYCNDRTIPFLMQNKQNWPSADELLRSTEYAFHICKKNCIHNLLFLTISPFFDLNNDNLEILKRSDIRLYGILHGDVPQTSEKIRNAVTLENYFERLFVFHEECLSDYANIPFKKLPSILPHPPSLLLNWNNYNLQKNPQQKVRLGFLGEFRSGKGYELACEFLYQASENIKNSIECIFCGGFRDQQMLDKIKRSLYTARIKSEFYTKKINLNFHVIPDALFADAILNSDIILFPYHDAEKAAFSGVFIDGLVSGAIFLATQDSVMGRIIKKHSLGFTFDLADSQTFYSALKKAIVAVRENSLSEAKAEFLHNYINGSVINIQDYLHIVE